MYKINNFLAVNGVSNGIGEYEKDINENLTGSLFIVNKERWIIVDCRSLNDSEKNLLKHYKSLINLTSSYIEKIKDNIFYECEGVVCCCAMGASRSNAIALGVIMKDCKLDYFDALNLIKEKNPISRIAIHHLDAIRKIFRVKFI